MRIKKGDNVKVMAGKGKGKTGKISQVIVSMGKVVVDGVNPMKKHMKSRQPGTKGQTLEFFAPLPVSSVMVICPKCDKASRLGMKAVGDKKVRFCKKCNETIE